jgi:predicted TIM-barrel fold metal-dependent hydrolase
MDIDDLILVSVDDHVVEPPDLFERHVSTADFERAPRIVHKDDLEADVWSFEGVEVPNVGLNAVAGRPPEEYGFEPTAFDEMRRGAYDIHERVRDMNANGLLGSMCFPSMPGFCGQLFGKSPDRELAFRLLQGYNNWHIDEWCGSYPGRFMPLAIAPIWDPELMAAEVRRVAEKGCHAVAFSENPSKLGYPSFHTDHWDPFWRACEETGTVVCLHIGSSSSMSMTSADAPIDVTITITPVNILMCAADLIWSQIFRKFPDLRIALSEGGIGWIPYFLDRIDFTYTHHKAWTFQDFGDQLPSEVFHEHVVTCFIDDPTGLKLLDDVGLDMVTWECDYPHADTAWPHAPEVFMKSAGHLSDAVINKITHENAMRIFRYDPFTHRAQADCTVAALRAESPDVELVTRSPRQKKSKADLSDFADAVEKMMTSGGD